MMSKEDPQKWSNEDPHVCDYASQKSFELPTTSLGPPASL
jgi:hypothetical protein